MNLEGGGEFVYEGVDLPPVKITKTNTALIDRFTEKHNIVVLEVTKKLNFIQINKQKDTILLCIFLSWLIAFIFIFTQRCYLSRYLHCNKKDRQANGFRIYMDTGKNCQLSLLTLNSFIGQFVHPVGGKGMGFRSGESLF